MGLLGSGISFWNLKCQIPPAGEMDISQSGAENMQDEPAWDILSPPERKEAIKDLEANLKGAPTSRGQANLSIQKNYYNGLNIKYLKIHKLDPQIPKVT